MKKKSRKEKRGTEAEGPKRKKREEAGVMKGAFEFHLHRFLGFGWVLRAMGRRKAAPKLPIRFKENKIVKTEEKKKRAAAAQPPPP